MLNKLRILLARKRLEKQFRGDKPSDFGQQLKQYKWLKPKYILGYLTLFVVLILQGNDQWLSSYITSLRYSPTPAIIESPWPWEKNASIHELISNMNGEHETDIKSVANYIKMNESDPYLRIKAVHDYVISRVTYDREVLETGVRPSQEAKEVFKTGKAVCEGYAKLFQAIATEMGEEVVYIEGKVRGEFAPDDIIPQYLKWSDPLYDWTRHAWNGVKIDNNWYLVDTTWDDSERNYYTDYLMPNEKVMNISHLPDQEAWQLSNQPHSAQKFEKQPLLTPDFFKKGLEPLSPIQY
ncbi:MAG: transglutaminase domain-containing protein, partial [Crocosphaera sp.]